MAEVVTRMRVFDIGGRDDEEEVVGDRILTIPNVLSLLRIAILPFAFVDLVNDRVARATLVLFIFGATDWFDGFLARRLNQVSKLGKLLDPLSDRLMIATVTIAMIIADILPLWVVVLLLSRDVVLVLGAAVFLARGATPPAVTRVGKAATFGLMFAVGFFLLAATFAPDGEAHHEALRTIAWVELISALVLYYVAALQYLRAVVVGADEPSPVPLD